MDNEYINVIEKPMSAFWNYSLKCPECGQVMRSLQMKFYKGKYYRFMDCKQHANHTTMIVFMETSEFNKRNR